MVRFRELMCDASFPKYGGKLISNKQDNGEFDFWLVIELTDMEDACGEIDGGRWAVSLESVSPSEAKGSLESAFSCCGIEEESLQQSPIVQVEALSSYGAKAVIWQDQGDNYKALLKEARRQAQAASMLYGFYMDRPQNRIGTTGWEAQSGNIMAGLARMPQDDLTARIMRKMQGEATE